MQTRTEEYNFPSNAAKTSRQQIVNLLKPVTEREHTIKKTKALAVNLCNKLANCIITKVSHSL